MKWREVAVDPIFNLECFLDSQEQAIEEKDKEIERLKAYKDLYKDLLNQSEDNIKQLIKKLNDYKQRNNKVIEYIDEHILFVNGGIIKSILNGSDDIYLIQCEHKWYDAYGYEKSQMKKDLIDYITNLQQENESLKRQINDIKRLDRMRFNMVISHYGILKESGNNE